MNLNIITANKIQNVFKLCAIEKTVSAYQLKYC